MDHIWKSFQTKTALFRTLHLPTMTSDSACFGTSVGKCALPIERAYFLKQACRCFMLWCSEECVSIFSWMWNRRARNGYCPAFVSWPSTCDCLHLLNMLDSSEWCHSFVHISIQWAQRDGRGSPAEWGWSECCRKGNLWWMERHWFERNVYQGARNEMQSVGMALASGRPPWANGRRITLMRFYHMSLDIHA